MTQVTHFLPRVIPSTFKAVLAAEIAAGKTPVIVRDHGKRRPPQR